MSPVFAALGLDPDGWPALQAARFERLTNQLGAHPSTLELLGEAQAEGLAGMVQADRVAFLEERGLFAGFARVPELQAELDELIAEEIRVATDEWECAEPHHRPFLDVFVEYEQQFVEDHGDQIALLAAS